MRGHGVDPGVPLTRLLLGADAGPSGAGTSPGGLVPEHVLLVAVTEINTPEALDRYVAAARETLAALTPEEPTP